MKTRRLADMLPGDVFVQGLSLIPGNACVASTFRVKDRRDFWKVVCILDTKVRRRYAHTVVVCSKYNDSYNNPIGSYKAVFFSSPD